MDVGVMERYYKEIIVSAKSIPKEDRKFPPDGYMGHSDKVFGISNAIVKPYAFGFVKKYKHEFTTKQWLELCDLLIMSGYDELKRFPGYFLMRLRDVKEEMPLEKVYEWLGYLNGWAQVDSLCQTTFDAKDLDVRWEQWKELLIKLNVDKNISRRRASLVLLTKPVKTEDRHEYADLGLEMIGGLLGEDDKLITKAQSWLLREMTKHYPAKVKAFLGQHQKQLPSFVIREVTRKLETGKK